MVKYIPITEAIWECEKPKTLIPSGFLRSIPNSLGINLSAVKGFGVEMTEDDQYKSIRIDFIPAEIKSE